MAEEIDCGYLADYEKGNEPNSLICRVLHDCFLQRLLCVSLFFVQVVGRIKHRA